MTSDVRSRFEVGTGSNSKPPMTGDFSVDATACSKLWSECAAQLADLPAKAERSETQQSVAEEILASGRRARTAFLGRHVEALYGKLTKDFTEKRRVEEIAVEVARLVPGLVPDDEVLQREGALEQKNKDGHEIDQGILFNAILANERCGLDLCHAMLLPKPASLELAEKFAREGRIDLGSAYIDRVGKVSTVRFNNPRYLNAEDESTLVNVETVVDLALLDAATDIAILRGAPIESGKYAGKTVSSTGINLTHLYQGKITFLWYLIRDLGFVNKMFRGLAYPDVPPGEVDGDTLEKPWIGTVEKFAIGGGCQYLLATDFVVADSSAYLTLPARKEGIIPGVANMRLPRFVGDRIARQAIQYERRIDCDSPEGRLICDLVVEPEKFDVELDAAAQRLTSSGVVSAASNRRAFRVTEEPLDAFRRYMAVYAREQAACHFSPALIRNLVHFWDAQNRR
ncbi:MAG: enoyl-CoA hydratase/isomerase family protein [Hyphomicrobiaceae bacterium]